jgi:hypothetical protein
MRWVWHVGDMGGKKDAFMVLGGKPEGKNHFEDLDMMVG